jgi:hypothetical protein
MNRPVAAVVSLGFLAVFAIAGCGDASAPGINGPGAHPGTISSDHDAAPDQGSGFQDPKAQDGGCSSPNLVCNGVCTAVDSDPASCGACGNACIGGDAICLAGKCACSGSMMDYCDGAGCMDVSSDFANCGACGNACDPNNDQACSNGMCVPNDP